MNAQVIFTTFTSLHPKQWTVTAYKNSLRLINNYSHDEFQYETNKVYSSHLLYMYKARVQYRISNTPQIILPRAHSDKTKIELLVQRCDQGIEAFLLKQNCQGTVTNLFVSILKTLQILAKKYGFFRVNKNMIKMSRSQNLLIWVNSSFASNHRQFPLTHNSSQSAFDQLALDLSQIFANFNHASILNKVNNKVENQALRTLTRVKSSQFARKKPSFLSKGKYLGQNSSKLEFKSSEKKKESKIKNPNLNIKNLDPLSDKRLTKESEVTKLKSLHMKSLSGLSFRTEQNTKQIEKFNPQRLSSKQIHKKVCYHKNLNAVLSTKNWSQNVNSLNKRCSLNILPAMRSSDKKLHECQSPKRNQFRQTANSQATTNFFTSSSGSTKLIIDDSIQQSTNFSSNEFKIEISRQNSPEFKQKKNNKFRVNTSKIISEKNEELTIYNYSFMGNDCDSKARASDIVRDLDSLMMSDTIKDESFLSKEMLDLENALDKILNS